ncbi:hypothetical protein F2Q69_00006818 [Brassica cretica]|uniref:Uncharacterized protein n=1 Tax=Brassica cretica TaxID=69181 RepID=A0A8S9NZ96_BRACR|nr:hypothetical protein F2Q69_00006818 [Brassica cretica]
MDSRSLEIALVTQRLRKPRRSGKLEIFLDPKITSGDHIWNPEAIQEPRGSSLDPEIFSWNPKAVWEPGGTELRLPRQNYCWYLFGSCIMPLGSWALSSSYVVFYFCRKSLTNLRGAGTGPGELHSGEPGFLLAGTQSLPLIARFRHRTRGITCALKSTGVAHSQQASPRQNIAPVILRSRVPLRPEPHYEPGGGLVPFLQTGSGDIEPLVSCRRWGSCGLLMASWRRWSLEL